MPDEVVQTEATEATETEQVTEEVKEPEVKDGKESETETEQEEVTESEETKEPTKDEDAESDELVQIKGQLTDKENEVTDLTAKLKKSEAKVDDLKTQVKSLSTVVESLVENKVKAIPEEFHGLIPDGDAVSKLAWITKAEESGIFTKQELNVEIGKPLELTQADPKAVSKMSPQQKMSHYFSQAFSRN
ncbi:hypothetical protein [Bacillus inaquosorum]|uniref:hypothetical protein n=1 Tax=Bacillus inaquosorum TaxID=483913 RepID=UPI00227EC7F2|nr:hypothetical protein [Bacillus inaquosorum]MCY8796257.1 hypothetical protein [Bacillus inaquosorum]MEC0772035.1 hypothetical protein [Bacillus inaquosorum]MEC0797404.1 hypothetical protein [Bacillus inaquosorum]